MHYSTPVDTSSPPPLRRTHSLEFETGAETPSNSREAETHTAPQLFNSLDIETFLNGEITPTSTIQAATAAKSRDWSQEIELYSYTVGSAAITETVASVLSEESDESIAELLLKDKATDKQKPLKKSRKEEIDALRVSAEKLTKRLETLKAPPTLEPATSNQSSSSLKKYSGPSLWKIAAARQLERRRKAEEDNKTLREMLKTQVQEAKCLQRILKRRTKIQMLEATMGMKRRKTARVSSAPSDNSSVLKKMLSDTDRIFADVDNHLASESMMELPCPGRKREVNLNTTNGIFYVNAQRTMLPFGFFKTQKAAWEVLKELGTSGLRRIQDWDKLVDFHAQRTEKTRDTIATSYFSETPSQQQIRGAQVRKVMRMFIEEDRAVFIWEMLAEPTLKGTNLPAGYHLQSTMQVIMRHGEMSSIDGENSTEISIHFSASRRDLDLPTSANFREPGHLDIGISVWGKLISCIVPEVENVLIDETGSTWNVDE